MRSAREVAHEIFDASGDWMYPCPENSHLPPCDILTAAIEARDAEHATEATRLRDQLWVARDVLPDLVESVCSEYCNETTGRHVGMCVRGRAAIASLETP